MFSVIFEVHPRADRWDDYLAHARMLRPELEDIDGFVDNTRYRSLTRDGWLLSLSGWRDEKAVVRRRTTVRHHQAQVNGRDEILSDYHLRVGQVTGDTHVPEGHILREQRLDETDVGLGTTAVMITAQRPAERAATCQPKEVAAFLGLPPGMDGLVEWDVFDAVLAPGDLILLTTWRDGASASAFQAALPEGGRRRQVRVVRDYGMFDRREAPQYYPDICDAPAFRG